MRYPLRFVIPLALFLTGIVAAIAVAATSLKMSETQTEQLVTELLTTIGNQAAADVAAGLRGNDPGRIRGAIEQLQVLRGLTLGALVDDTNKVMYSTIGAELNQRYDYAESPDVSRLLQATRASGVPRFEYVGNELYYANYIAGSMPAFLGGGRTDHVLLLTYDYAALHAGQRAAAANQALIIAIAILALSALSWMILGNALFSRMSQLVTAIRNIGSGNLQTPVKISGQDEIAFLGNAMDRMRLELAENNDRLQAFARDLEAAKAAVERERSSLAERVENRTRELTRANRDLERAKEAAEAASRAKSNFLATVSHEIRTPMNGVLGAMELLDRSGLDEQRAPLLHTAQQSARSLLVLLNDLLDMAKIEAGRMELVNAPASVEAILDHVLATHAPTAMSKRTRISSHVDSSTPPWIATDALRVQQVLGNFVSNAVKFTTDGQIDIRVAAALQQDGRYRLCFTVTDTGPGIRAAVLERLFEPFEQGSDDVSRRAEGSGLGLAICHGLAKRMGGSVSLESTPGEGTTARFELPADAGVAPAGESASNDSEAAWLSDPLESQPGSSNQDVRILVVDDHPVNRMLQARQLEQLGVAADTACDGVEALDMLRGTTYDMVITDCEMPGLDGFGLTRAIRSSDDVFAGIPVIACTAHAMPEVASRCRETGMNDVLTKPLQLDDLARILHNQLPDKRRSNDAAGASGIRRLPAVFDSNQLNTMTAGDDALRTRLFDTLLRDSLEASADAEAAIGRQDFEDCRAIAHRSKGASQMFGAELLGDAFAELEYWANQEPVRTEHVSRALRRVRAECTRLARLSSVAA